MNNADKKIKICLTGATGFIGKNLIQILENDNRYEVVALSRQVSPQMDGAKKGNITWKRCNGFSLYSVEQATQDCDIIIYLIHSMSPSSTLSQGTFAEFDLMLADNFARAANKNGVKKIIYLSGLIPNSDKLSEHLLSRLEVENVLAQFNNDVTTLRAGLIIGLDGSSFKILERLIKRLPILILPGWTKNKTQPIDIRDVLANITYCIENFERLQCIYDIGGPDVVTYGEMLRETAKTLHLKRRFLSVPLFSPKLSKLWVSTVTQTSKHLVYPLIDSLKHSMIVDQDKKLEIENHQYQKFIDSLNNGLSKKKESWFNIIIDYNSRVNLRWLENVTSIQRVKSPPSGSAKEVAMEYFQWLSRFLSPIIRVRVNEEIVHFCFMKFFPLLTLERNDQRSSEDRVVYFIVGGILAKETSLNGRMEMRYIPATGDTLISIIDFRPSLPWFIYKYTQAYIHLFVMKRFQKNMQKKYS